mgnify:CR=1 FL=1
MYCCHTWCSAAVPETSLPHHRLHLCATHAALGCLAFCESCGEPWPEHGPHGRGCALWLQAEDLDVVAEM